MRPPAEVCEAIRSVATPRCVYVYRREALRAAAEAVRAVLPSGSTLLYAVKANGHPGVLAALAGRVDGFEVASGGELALALAAGAADPVVVFGGPGKTDAELAAAVRAGATVNVESEWEARRLDLVARELGRAVSVTVRVNRADSALPGALRMTGLPTPFGVDEAGLDSVVAVARGSAWLRPVGFGLHAVSNNLDAAAHAGFISAAVRWSVAAARRYGIELRQVNVGGGFGVDYTGGGRFELGVLARELARDGAGVPDGARLVVELGRFLAAEAGWYAAEVLDLKRTHGRWFAVIRGGTHHFRLPASWGYSHPVSVLAVDEWRYPLDRPQVRDVVVDVVGELCTPRDVLSRNVPVARLRVGDVLVFGRTGAYAWDISHHDFLRHDRPRFVLV